MGTTLLVWPLLGRILAPQSVGQLSAVLAVSSILAPVVTLGTHLHIANRLARDPGRAGGPDGRLVRFLLGTLIVVALVSTAGVLVQHDEPVLRTIAVVAATGCSIIGIGVVRGLDRALSYAVLTLWAQFVALLLLTVVAWASGSLDVALASYALALVAGTVLVLPLVRRRDPGRTDEGVTRIGVQSLSLVPHLVLAVATLLLARIIVGFVAGPVGLAGFQYASLLIGGVTTIGASLDAHWSTRAQAAVDERDLRGRLDRNLVRIQLLLLVVALGVVVFVFALLPVWLPPSYDVTTVRAAVIVSLSAGAFQALADNRSAALMWLGRPGFVSVATALGVVAAAVGCVALVLAFGWVAAGAAIALGTATRAAAITVFLRRVSPGLGLDRRAVTVTAACVAALLSALLLTLI
ncbi:MULTISPECIES: lipopolysaccharide biosynthesis protein [unclassified Curtobacterium]|uniref:lipopolysaccharide biosynthesis protein n=1 Tax=unclassified Curtobacterium TaxID=257496 RepID=UPI0008DDA5E9|nr:MULTISPECIES: hypothetical protein [unclassified Curtobacterium]OIH95734.1 hypothetical protein BIU92_04330 [Curtobacterium sp. MCBA15_003]OII31303.1 hypothetical protein BIU94_04885 [Curtobacterium sp. MMLR14_006]